MKDLALYVHWPFCLAKCPYCDFNSHVRQAIDTAQWQQALLAELAWHANHLPGHRLSSIFFGGGTPSLMPPSLVAAIIDHAARHWPVAVDIEITLEANPTSVEAGKLKDFRGAGVNRLSLGVQALEDTRLRQLGRAHDSKAARTALAIAARLFDRYSFDLIYATAGQQPAAWAAELEAALALTGTHLSLYQLTIEPGTVFAERTRRGEQLCAVEDDAASMFLTTQQRLAAAGLPAYEISNFAAAGAESRHNLTYWRYGAYAGIGPGAHGRWHRPEGIVATVNHRLPEPWLAAVADHGHGQGEATPLSRAEAMTEALLMGLRLREGVRASRFQEQFGIMPRAAVDAQALQKMTARGFIADGDDLRLLPEAFAVAGAVTQQLLRSAH